MTYCLPESSNKEPINEKINNIKSALKEAQAKINTDKNKMPEIDWYIFGTKYTKGESEYTRILINGTTSKLVYLK